MRNAENLALYTLIVICLGVFCFMGWRYMDVEFLALTNGDAMPQFLQLQKMYQGLTTFNIKQFFAFEFYNYGFFYYMLNLLAALPFIITENYSLQIYAPRVLNALFSIANIWLLYRIARTYLSALDSMLIIGIFVAMSGFWHQGYIYKPDVFQAFFVLACAYYLLRDNFSFGKHYTLAWIALGLGMGVAKFQAILFIPMVYAYIFMCMRTQGIIPSIKRAIVATFGIFAIWIATNPYLLHPRGFNAWYAMFAGNMNSNATNHGAYTQVSLSDKLAMIDYYYFEIVVFIVLFALCCYLLWLGAVRVFRDSSDNAQTLQSSNSTNAARQQDFTTFESNTQSAIEQAKDSRICDEKSGLCERVQERILGVCNRSTREAIHDLSRKAESTNQVSIPLPFAPIAAGFLVSLIYLLFFVNKAWEAYYFSTMMLGCVLFIPLALIVAKTSKGGGQHYAKRKQLYQTATLSLLFALQILGGFMSNTYNQVFTKYPISLDSARALAQELTDLARPFVTDPNATIFSDNVNFYYLSLGLKPTQIYQIFGLPNADSFVYEEWSKKSHSLPFIPKDFIILSQNWWLSSYEERAHTDEQTKEVLEKLFSGQYPYKQVAKSEHFIIFANTDEQHSNILAPTPKE